MDLFIPLLRAFVVGGILCGIGQLLIDFTKLTPARILTGYVVTGVILGGIGVYQKLVDFAGAGASVPLLGFGNLLAKGVTILCHRTDSDNEPFPINSGNKECVRFVI